MTDFTPAAPLSMERAVSVAFVKSSGGFAVQLDRGSMVPDPEWDPRKNTRGRSSQILDDIDGDDSNIGIHLHGKLVDVDVNAEDLSALVPALDALLPACLHVWGRASRPRTHRVYMIDGDKPYKPADHPVVRRIKDLPAVDTSIRGGALSRGEFTLLPGSLHPDGELYEWAQLGAAKEPPSVASLDEIISGLRMASAIALLAVHWNNNKHDRDDIMLAIGGFLHRAHDLAKSMGDGLFSMSRESAAVFVDTFLDVVQADPARAKKWRHSFDVTWSKADKGDPVKGATSLGKIVGDPDLVTALYALLTDSPEVHNIDRFMERFAIWKGPAQVIDLEMVRNGNPRPYMSRQQFASSYGHEFVEMSGGRRLLPEMMWSMSAAQRVSGVTFEPGGDEIVRAREGDQVNLWSGYAVEPWSKPVPASDIGMFLDYIWDIICSRREESYQWVIAWIADIFQHAANKSGTTLVLVGLSGVGKTFLGENILGKIIGDRHYSQTNSIDHLTGSFNSLYSNQLLIQCDEAMNVRQRSAAAKLKALITDAKQRVEPKGIDAFFMPMHSRFLFTSNETEDAMYLNQGFDDRRYTVLEVSASKKGMIDEYWGPFGAWLDLPDTLPKIHRYLMDLEYVKASIKLPLRTAAKEKMQQRSWDDFDAWLGEMLSRNHPLSEESHDHWTKAPLERSVGSFIQMLDRSDWPAWVSPEALAEDFRLFLKATHGKTPPMPSAILVQRLKSRGLYPDELTNSNSKKGQDTSTDPKTKRTVKRRYRVVRCLSRSRLAEYLESRYGFRVESTGIGEDLSPTVAQSDPNGLGYDDYNRDDYA